MAATPKVAPATIPIVPKAPPTKAPPVLTAAAKPAPMAAPQAPMGGSMGMY